MIIYWERWGISVLYITLAWMLVVLGAAIAFGVYEPDPHKSDKLFNQLVCLWLVLSAASVYALAHYRAASASRRADASSGPMLRQPPEVDTFLFIRMSYWTYILLALALWAFVASFFG